eukprot:jgi/Undpi1/3688/HiC_scaffold_16.g07058.m1
MDEDQGALEAFTFTKIILKLGTIERVLRRIKVVFQSVDHGDKGHVTKQELKEGLHKAKVDLGEEWKDTNIDECLEHLRGGGANQDEVGLREFVVMLAVGRVCRPLQQDGEEDEAQRKEMLRLKTINEGEARKSTLMSGSLIAEAAAAKSAEVDAKAAAATAAAPIGDGEKGSRYDGVEAEKVPTASAGIGGLPQGSSWSKLKWARIPALRHVDASGGAMDSSGRSMLSLTRALSGSSVSFTKKPPSSNIQISGDGGGGGSGSGSGEVESDVSLSVKYVLDLFIAAYFQFDTTGRSGCGVRGGGDNEDGVGGGGGVGGIVAAAVVGRGFIKKGVLEKNLRKAERESGGSALLDQKRWSELAWDGDRLSFQEFMYAFAQWLGLLEDEDIDEQDPIGRPSKNGVAANSKASANATAKALAIADAKSIADALSKASANAIANANANSNAKGVALADVDAIADPVSRTNASADAADKDSANANINASTYANSTVGAAKSNANAEANAEVNADANAGASSFGREVGDTSVSAGETEVAVPATAAGAGEVVVEGEEQRASDVVEARQEGEEKREDEERGGGGEGGGWGEVREWGRRRERRVKWDSFANGTR